MSDKLISLKAALEACNTYWHKDAIEALKALPAVDPNQELLDALKDALTEFEYIYGHAAACVVQRIPTDDNIIADHIENVADCAKATAQNIRAAIAKHKGASQ